MTRTLSSAITSEVTASTVNVALLTELEFDSGTLRLWTGYGDLIIGTDTFTGAGDIATISPVQETVSLKSTGVNLTVSGLDSSILSSALSADYQDRPAKVWLAFFDSVNAYITRIKIFQGRMDVMNINESGNSASISISIENILVSLERPNERRYTAEDQKSQHPNDLGFDSVVSLQQKEITWGR